MTTLNSIMNTASMGMFTAQTGLGVTSDNITNVNTPGYVRKIAEQGSVAAGGVGLGVSVSGVTRAANQFLQNASLSAAGRASSASAVSDLLGQAQALFGDPSSTTSYLDQINQAFSDFSALANDPASGINNIQAVTDVNQFLDQSKSISDSLSQLSSQADSRARSDVNQANQLLGQIAGLNDQITAGTSTGADATNAQNAQSQLINQLSNLMDVQASTSTTGAVVLRAASGATLVGVGGAATLSYQSAISGSSQVMIALPGGGSASAPLTIANGEINGLLSLRNTLLPNASVQLSAFVSGAVSAINAASNSASSVPAPGVLTGRNTGLDQTTAVTGMTGITNVAIVSATGQLQTQININFGTGVMTDGSGNVTNFTPATFDTSLTTALGGNGAATFTNGVLNITAASGSGVAVADDPTTPSSKAGQGFSQFFGLNDLISTTGIANFHIGLTAGSANGFSAGTVALQLTNSAGVPVASTNVSIPAGGTIQTVLNALNANPGGLGAYGQFNLDSTGYLSFAPSSPGATLAVANDNTQWGVSGASVTQLFGLGAAQQIGRIASFQIRPDIAAAPTKLQTATLDLTAPPNPVLSVGDGSGALAISKAGQAATAFDAAGNLPAMQSTLTQYAAQLGGTLGEQAANAAQTSTNATAVQTEADTRRTGVEGVNLDQELVALTTYQQAYSASARLVTANQDMFTALIGMMR